MTALENAMQIVNEARAEYDAYAAEQRACGYEVPSFDEWAGVDSARHRAEARLQHHIDNDTLDLY